MKKRQILKPMLLTSFLIAFNMVSYAQLSFSISPGIGLNSANVGYKISEKITPFFGFQYPGASVKYNEVGTRYDYDLNRVVNFDEENELSGGLYIPNIGIKYYVGNQEKLKSYLSVSLSKPFLSAKLINAGEEDEDFMEDLKNVSSWGGEFAFGAEYFFDPAFSIAGEFGLRRLRLNYKDSYEGEYYNPDIGDYVSADFEDNYRFSANPTYTRISLNFYF